MFKMTGFVIQKGLAVQLVVCLPSILKIFIKTNTAF
jgi:hypothetical protein